MIYISAALIIMGFTAMCSQIILLRELFVVFYGNEISLGFILASWLVSGAVGSWILPKYISSQFPKKTFAFCQIILALILPVHIILVRSVPNILGVASGTTIDFVSMALISFVLLFPICVLLGFMFSTGCRVYTQMIGARAVGRVYVLEAIGSAVGGILTGFLLIRIMSSTHTMAMLALLNAISAVFLLRLDNKTRIFRIFAITLSLVMILGCLLGIFKKLDAFSINKKWKGFELVAVENSVHGNIVITKQKEQYSFFYNGVLAYTIPNDMDFEEKAHFPLLSHPDPKKILLIGGGIGPLDEILKHPVESVDYTELDPMIIRLAEEYLPENKLAFLKDDRLSVIYEDGRSFVGRGNKQYDCVIINIGEPNTIQTNRYYTVEFFSMLKKILNPGGIISFSVKSSENYIGRQLKTLLQCLYGTLNAVFKDVQVLPGNPAYFLASDTKVIDEYTIMIQRAKERRLTLRYVREYYLFSRFSIREKEYLQNVLTEKNVPKNYDQRPIAFYYDNIFWMSLFRKPYITSILASVNENRIRIVFFAVLVLMFSMLYFKKNARFKRTLAYAVMFIGFTGIAFQLVISLAFQSMYGYLFYQIGILFTAFMIGLALGGWYGTRIVLYHNKPLRIFVILSFSIGLYILAFPFIFNAITHINNIVVSQILFSILPFIAGCLEGCTFPLANTLCFSKEKEAGMTAGFLYGMDLTGSCVAALVVATLMIPILGIKETCFLVSIMMVFIAIILIFIHQYKGGQSGSD